jgi:hypothetical protein
METIKDAFRGFFFKDLKPIEKREGLRIGDILRVHKEKGKYILRFLKGTQEKTRQQYRDRLDEHTVEYEEGEDFTL